MIWHLKKLPGHGGIDPTRASHFLEHTFQIQTNQSKSTLQPPAYLTTHQALSHLWARGHQLQTTPIAQSSQELLNPKHFTLTCCVFPHRNPNKISALTFTLFLVFCHVTKTWHLSWPGGPEWHAVTLFLGPVTMINLFFLSLVLMSSMATPTVPYQP